MKRFNPLKTSGAATPKLAIVPVTNDAGAVVDAAVVAVVPDERKTEPRHKGRGRHSQGRGSARDARPDHLKVSVVTLAENEAKNGLQLHFPGKPDDATRAEMKASGWRWSFYNACWYHRNTPENRQWAEQFIARRQVATDKIVPLVAPPSQAEVRCQVEVRPPDAQTPCNIIQLPGGPAKAVPLWRRRLEVRV